MQFTLLFRRHYRDVLRFARRRVGSDAAQEIVAETFVVAWRRFNDVPVVSLAWLYRVATYEIANFRRRTAKDVRAEVAGSSGKTLIGDVEDTAILGHTMRIAWASLSNADREILRLVAWEGLGPPDGAAVLGCSISSYKVRLHRARRRLERRFRSLLGEGMSASDVPPKDIHHKTAGLDRPQPTKRILDGHTETEGEIQ